jgi:predicted DNA-binding antitoxin AbrB/MazE fold protein
MKLNGKEIKLSDAVNELDIDISEFPFICDASKVLGHVNLKDGRKAEVTLKLNTDVREWLEDDQEQPAQDQPEETSNETTNKEDNED